MGPRVKALGRLSCAATGPQGSFPASINKWAELSRGKAVRKLSSDRRGVPTSRVPLTAVFQVLCKVPGPGPAVPSSGTRAGVRGVETRLLPLTAQRSERGEGPFTAGVNSGPHTNPSS